MGGLFRFSKCLLWTLVTTCGVCDLLAVKTLELRPMQRKMRKGFDESSVASTLTPPVRMHADLEQISLDTGMHYAKRVSLDFKALRKAQVRRKLVQQGLQLKSYLLKNDILWLEVAAKKTASLLPATLKQVKIERVNAETVLISMQDAETHLLAFSDSSALVKAFTASVANKKTT